MLAKKIHIIGGKGYIGSLLTKYLKAFGHVVELSNYRLPNVPINYIDADIVIHLATAGGGTVHKPRPGNDDPAFMKSVNIDGMENLLKGIKNKKTKILFLSSTAVYGKFDDAPTVTEEAPLLPVSTYGLNKKAAEEILIKSGFDYMIIRPCGIFGASVNNNFGNSFLNKVLNNAIQNKQIELLGGDQKIDTVYLLDLIQIVVRACNGEWKSKNIFNIGGEIVSIKNMLQMVSNTLIKSGINCPLKLNSFNGKPATITNSDKLKKAFKWDPTPLEISIHSYVANYISAQ